MMSVIRRDTLHFTVSHSENLRVLVVGTHRDDVVGAVAGLDINLAIIEAILAQPVLLDGVRLVSR